MRKLSVSLIFCLLPAFASAAALEINGDTPKHHIVVKGDTLWDISSKTYNDSSNWPYLWAINRTQIKDPHWIYPGQDLLLYLGAPFQLKLTERLKSLPGANKPAPSQPLQPPGAPEISTHIISIYSGVSKTGPRSMVIIDKGQRDGIKDGLVLALYRDKTAKGRTDEKPSSTGNSYGLVQVYHTLDNVSYALVTKADTPVKLLDVASSVTKTAATTNSAIQLTEATSLALPVSKTRKSRRKGVDARKCLELPSDREIAACAEKFHKRHTHSKRMKGK